LLVVVEVVVMMVVMVAQVVAEQVDIDVVNYQFVETHLTQLQLGVVVLVDQVVDLTQVE
jgi:hypothetical protein